MTTQEYMKQMTTQMPLVTRIQKARMTERQNKEDFENDVDFESFKDNDISIEQESQDDIYTIVDDMNTLH